jgi:hypothetical protein
MAGAHEYGYYRVVFKVDASSEFDLGSIRPEVPSPSEMLRDAIYWLRAHRLTPEGGLVSLACFRRRIGPPDGEHEATPGEWHARDSSFRRPGKQMINMHEAVPLVEATLHDLEEAETQGLGSVI